MIKIKAECQDKILAFGNMGKTFLKNWPLNKLRDLLITGLESKDNSILDLFETPYPKLSSLKVERLMDELNTQ